jgi:malate dehydrogenase
VNSRRKVTIFGAGEVGAAAAMFIARRDSLGVILVDADGALAESAAADIAEAAPLLGYEPDVMGSADPAVAAGSEVVVIAAGNRPGDTRSRKDLLRKNSEIVTEICHGVMERCPNACVVVLTEPLDQTCELVARTTQFPRARLIGVSGVIDSARWSSMVALKLGVSVGDVGALVMGGRGEEIVPLESRLTVSGVAATELIAREVLDQIVAEVRARALLDDARSVRFSAAAAAAEIVDSICFDRGRVLSCHALLLGEYGVDGLFMGAPVRLGADGIQQILELELSFSERAGFEHAAAAARRSVDELAPL